MQMLYSPIKFKKSVSGGGQQMTVHRQEVDFQFNMYLRMVTGLRQLSQMHFFENFNVSQQGWPGKFIKACWKM